MGQVQIFKDGFSSQCAEPGDTISAEIGDLTIVAKIAMDDDADRPDERDEGFWPSLDPESCGYVGAEDTAKKHEEQMAIAKATMQAWEDGEWWYCGVVVTVLRDGQEIGCDSLWGVECNYPDSDNSYLLEVANDCALNALSVAGYDRDWIEALNAGQHYPEEASAPADPEIEGTAFDPGTLHTMLEDAVFGISRALGGQLEQRPTRNSRDVLAKFLLAFGGFRTGGELKIAAIHHLPPGEEPWTQLDMWLNYCPANHPAEPRIENFMAKHGEAECCVILAKTAEQVVDAIAKVTEFLQRLAKDGLIAKSR